MISQMLNQTVTIWRRNGQDSWGNGIYTSPQTAKCRWEDSQEMFVDKTGKEVASKAKVFLLSSAAKSDDYVFLGTSAASDPQQVTGAYEVRGVRNTPDLRNLKQLTVLYL